MAVLEHQGTPLRFRDRVLRVPAEVFALAGFAVLTRFLWITRPHAIVFDEVYFRDAALRYKDSSYYFDPHPPLGKLILAAWGQLIGVDATHSVADCTPSATVVCPPVPPSSTDPAVALRIIPALAGVALVIAFYYFLRELGTGRKVATLGASLLLLDNALTLESRLILLDSMLLCFGIAAITVFLVARRSTGRRHWVLLTVAAVLAGMCVSIKVTGFCVFGFIGICGLVTTIESRAPWRRWVAQAAILVVVPFAVFFGSYTVHSALLHNSGGDGDRFVSVDIQKTLKGNPNYDPGASVNPVKSFLDLQKATHEYEKALKNSSHPYQSKWTSWPLEKRSVYYYLGTAKNGKSRYEYLIGNPVVWWGTLFGVGITIIGWLLTPGLFRPHRRRLGLLAVTYLGSYLPLGLIHRPMFLYHYFFPLIFSLAFAVYGIGILAGWVPKPEPRPAANPGGERGGATAVTPLPVETDESAWNFGSRSMMLTYGGILVAALLTFLWFAPITYGLPLSDSGLHDRMWLHTWR